MPLHTDKLIQKEINKHNYMNNRTLLFVVAASLGCVNAMAGNVYDGTNDDKDISKSINLNPVVVTGNGHHQLLKSTTTPVHVLSQQAIKETGTTDFQDVLTKLMHWCRSRLTSWDHTSVLTAWETNMCLFLSTAKR